MVTVSFQPDLSLTLESASAAILTVKTYILPIARWTRDPASVGQVELLNIHPWRLLDDIDIGRTIWPFASADCQARIQTLPNIDKHALGLRHSAYLKQNAMTTTERTTPYD